MLLHWSGIWPSLSSGTQAGTYIIRKNLGHRIKAFYKPQTEIVAKFVIKIFNLLTLYLVFLFLPFFQNCSWMWMRSWGREGVCVCVVGRNMGWGEKQEKLLLCVLLKRLTKKHCLYMISPAGTCDWLHPALCGERLQGQCVLLGDKFIYSFR